MNPPIIFPGLVPTILRVINATLLSMPHFRIESAMRKPPMKRKMRGCAYGAAAASMEVAPRIGKRTSGKRAVAEMSIASVNHHIPIQIKTDMVILPE